MNRLALALLILTATAAASIAQAPTLKNPGFEEELAGWAVDLTPGLAQHLRLDATNPAEGKKSLCLSGKRGDNPWLAQGVGDIQPGATYTLSAKVRGSQNAPLRAAVKIEFYNAKNESTSGYYGAALTAADGSWQTVKVTARADHDTVKAAILLRLFGTGQVWFDDVQLTEATPAPAMTFTPSVLLADADAATDLTFEAHLLKPLGEGEPADFTCMLSGPDTEMARPLVAEVQQLDSRRLAVSLKLPALDAGSYQLTCALRGGDSIGLPLYVLPAERTPGLDDRGRWLANGQAILPIMLAHVTPQDYLLAAQAGFNCVQGMQTLDEATVRAELEAATKAGLRVILPLYPLQGELPEAEKALALARSVSGQPSVLGFALADEPDLQSGHMEFVAQLYAGLRQSQLQPALLSVAHPEAAASWGRLCDVLQVSPWPLPDGKVTLVGEQVTAATGALKPDQGLMAVLQAGWSPPTQPTLAQARQMAYLALMSGAHALGWYCLREMDWNLAETPLWGQFRQLNQEAGTLGAVLAQGQPVEQVECSNSALVVRAVTANDRAYFLVVNPTGAAVRSWVRSPLDLASATMLSSGAKLEPREHTLPINLPAGGADTIVAMLTVPEPPAAPPVPGPPAP